MPFLTLFLPVSKSGFKQSLSLIMLIALGFIWGSGYSLARYAMTHDVPTLGYSFWQSFGPAVLLNLFCLASGQIKYFTRKNIRYFFICGLVGIAIPNTNLYFVASHLPAGQLAVLVNTVPLLIYPMAILSRQEKPDILRFIALLLGVLGILAIIQPSLSLRMSHYWQFIAMISPLTFALCAIYVGKKQPETLNSLQAASGMLLTSTLLLLPLVFQQNSFYSLALPWNLTQEVVILEILLSTAGYILFFLLIRHAGAVFYSLTNGVVAITGLFWGYLLFSEQPTTGQWASISAIIFAIFLLAWRQTKQHQGA